MSKRFGGQNMLNASHAACSMHGVLHGVKFDRVCRIQIGQLYLLVFTSGWRLAREPSSFSAFLKALWPLSYVSTSTYEMAIAYDRGTPKGGSQAANASLQPQARHYQLRAG